MQDRSVGEAWNQFLEHAKTCCSAAAFGNWLAPIKVAAASEEALTLEVPNVFVKEYLLSNYGRELRAFVPLDEKGEPNLIFVVQMPASTVAVATKKEAPPEGEISLFRPKLNAKYRFENFIEGPTNQFVKSAAIGVATHPGQSYNPLFIHGGVGLGKTHILHSIGHAIEQKSLRVQCITTEAFINELVDSLRNKTIDKLKRLYRSDIDVLLVDDIQFLQNRLNFEEEFCHMFEALIHQRKQIVVTSDKPPGQLKLSERMVARMEWGLVAHLGMPELETRVAILQHKAKQRGLELPPSIAFYIAEHIYGNVRQLEGAVNKLCAHCRLLNREISEELVQTTLKEMFLQPPQSKISVEEILKAVAGFFEIRVSDLKGVGRTKEIAWPRQIAMYLACKLVKNLYKCWVLPSVERTLLSYMPVRR